MLRREAKDLESSYVLIPMQAILPRKLGRLRLAFLQVQGALLARLHRQAREVLHPVQVVLLLTDE